MKRLVYIFIAMAMAPAASLVADPSGLLGGAALPVESGSWWVSYGQDYQVDGQWYDQVNRLDDLVAGQQSIYVPSSVTPVTRKSMNLSLAVGWQVSRRHLLRLSLPAHFVELSPQGSQETAPASLNDPATVRSDQLGDMNIDYRLSLFQASHGALKLGLGALVPFGTHRFETDHTLLARGAGGWEFGFALHSAVWAGSHQLWVDGRYDLPVGYEANVQSNAFLAPGKSWPGGPAYVLPGPRINLVGGYSVDWHRQAGGRHSLAVELRYLREGDTLLGGASVEDSGRSRLDLMPQAQFRFSNSLTIVAGFNYPVAGDNDLQTSCDANGLCGGDIHARADFHIR